MKKLNGCVSCLARRSFGAPQKKLDPLIKDVITRKWDPNDTSLWNMAFLYSCSAPPTISAYAAGAVRHGLTSGRSRIPSIVFGRSISRSQNGARQSVRCLPFMGAKHTSLTEEAGHLGTGLRQEGREVPVDRKRERPGGTLPQGFYLR
jgi:hypothetical protein